jgi:regulator of sigma E protease
MSTIIILSLLVLLHEFGHFLVAKLFGIHVEEFGIGLPPKALKLFKRKETEYTLNWLPIGGFVRLAGEEHDPSLWEKINPLTRKHMFFAKPAWQRALVILAGVTMNFLIGILAFAVIYTVIGIPNLSGNQVVVATVSKGSPAQLAGITENEVVVRVGDTTITTADQFVALVKDKKGQAINIYVAKMDVNGLTSDSSQVITVIPRENPPAGEGALGVSVSTMPIVTYEKKPWYSAPYYGAVEGMKEAWGWTREFLHIFSHPAELLKNLSGPVAVVKVGQQAAKAGWTTLLRFAGIISLNLAIFNLLPIPALDGGRLVMVGLEKIVGRKRVAKYEKYVNAVGMGLLILLLVGVTVKDLFFS